jgi:hypothetical protein
MDKVGRPFLWLKFFDIKSFTYISYLLANLILEGKSYSPFCLKTLSQIEIYSLEQATRRLSCHEKVFIFGKCGNISYSKSSSKCGVRILQREYGPWWNSLEEMG